MNNIDWISVKDKLPPISESRKEPKHILIAYAKTKKSSYAHSGKTGLFMTQGYIICVSDEIKSETHSKEFWENLGYGLCFYDYTDRQIQNLSAKASKNFVMYWSEMPNTPETDIPF